MSILTLAISTCPNDTFMFEAMINGRIDTEGLKFDLILADIKELNRIAGDQKADICKVSFYAYSSLQDSFQLLESGSALGRGCGPLLIARNKNIDTSTSKILIPGTDTTANLLLKFYQNNIVNKEVCLFSEIIPNLVSGKADAGVIIHESRFTYQDYGLFLIRDLGEYWEQETGLPIPLGGIVARRKLGKDTIQKIDRILKRSIIFAFNNPEVVMPYVRSYAQEMDEEVMKSHISLYVNDYSLTLGSDGIKAVDKLLILAKKFQ